MPSNSKSGPTSSDPKTDRGRAAAAKPAAAALLDLDKLLGDRPEARKQAALAETVAAAGELVRRLRVARGLSEQQLARRIGSTQAHLSELERGLGANGPTVRTLARIFKELGDELLIDSRRQRDEREARLVAEAQSTAAGIARGMVEEAKGRGPAYAVQQWAIGSRTTPSALTRMLLEGLAIGLYAGLSRREKGGQGKGGQSEVDEAKRALERNLGEAEALTSNVVDVVKSV